LGQGIVFVQGRIDQERSNVVIAQLLFMDGQHGDKPVSIYINSPDGDLRATLAIYDTMQVMRRQIGTVCAGIAAGPAVLLMAAGTPGKRLAYPHARLGLQRPEASLKGTAAEIDVRARELLKVRQQFNELLARHSGQLLEKIERDTDRGVWFSAEEARDYGLIDAIIAPDQRP
jgi:ATP-dependent Clp protease protease subunit